MPGEIRGEAHFVSHRTPERHPWLAAQANFTKCSPEMSESWSDPKFRFWRWSDLVGRFELTPEPDAPNDRGGVVRGHWHAPDRFMAGRCAAGRQ
jgi:hypothetical protein